MSADTEAKLRKMVAAEAMYAALAELVRLKDANPMKLSEQIYYAKHAPLAWEEARAALALARGEQESQPCE